MVRVRDEQGAVVTVTMIALTLMMIMTAFAVDLGHGRSDRALADATADAGALAGAQSLPSYATAKSVAQAYATKTLTTGSVVADPTITVTTPYSMPGSTYPSSTLINVKVCWDMPTGFAAAVGIKHIHVCGEATARQGDPSCGLCVLGPEGLTLSSTGSGALRVSGAGIHVNSDGTPAAKITNPSAGGIKTDRTFRIVGTYDEAATGQFSPTPTTNSAPIPDPLSDLPVPSVAGPFHGSVSVSGSSGTTLHPGIYDSITSSSSGQVTLTPGIYVIKKKMSLSGAPSPGSQSVAGDGVTLFFACEDYPAPCDSGESGASLSMSGGSTIDLKAPKSGPMRGIAVYLDRNSTSSVGLTGTSTTRFTGAIYMKSGALTLTGTSDLVTMNAVIVTGTLTRTGDSEIVLSYDAATAPPAMQQGVSLVE